MLYHGTKPERVLLRQRMGRRQRVSDTISCCPVVITSYEITMNDCKQVSMFGWKLIAVDEGHRLKNSQCRLIK